MRIIRKIGKLGGTSLFITLPIEWLIENKLSKGDELQIEIMDDSLVIHKPKVVEEAVEEVVEDAGDK